ncbi:MAG TPA: lipid II flippase MurJ [Terriglobia bacterium]|nr:lipid II flippase MurJ [Terriglobia bacterium]
MLRSTERPSLPVAQTPQTSPSEESLRLPRPATAATTGSADHRIFRAATILSSLAGLVLVATTAKELAVANFFGRGDALDAYLTAYVLPSFVVNIVAGSFNSAVIPTFVEVRERDGAAAAQRLFSSAMVWSLAVLGALSLLLAALAPWYLPLLGSGFTVAKLLLTRKLLYLLLPLVVMSAITVNGTAVLNAGERFALPALLPILAPLGGLAALLAFGRTWSIYALAAGTVAGTALQAWGLARTARSHGISLRPRWYGLDPKLRQVIGQYVPMVAGALLMSSTDLVDQSMAAMLPPGSVSALSYARKIVTVLVVVGAMPLGAAALPYFSEMAAKQDWASCRKTLRTYSGLVALVTVPATVGLFLFAQPLVRILFQRGAFTAHDTLIVARTEAWLALEIPFYVLATLGVRLVSALKRNGALMAITALNTVLNAVLNWVLMRRYGVAGIALSTSIVYLVSCALVFGLLYVLIGERLDRNPLTPTT